MEYFGKANKAKEENNEKTATEIMNLKITNAQMQRYKEEQKMPDLQYLADRLCEDGEIAYVKIKDKKTADLEGNSSIKPLIKIESEEDSILTKLNEYPYEFEIDGKLRLASINGVKVADTSESEEIKKLNDKIKQLETRMDSTATTLIERKWAEATNSITANAYEKLETVSLSGHGKGKAIISFTVSNRDVASASMCIADIKDENEKILGAGGDKTLGTKSEWLRASTSTSILYDENTSISFYTQFDVTVKPHYRYSILLIPDAN